MLAGTSLLGEFGTDPYLRKAAGAIDAAGIRPVVDHVHEFEDAASGDATLARGNRFGRVAIPLGDRL